MWILLENTEKKDLKPTDQVLVLDAKNFLNMWFGFGKIQASWKSVDCFSSKTNIIRRWLPSEN